MKYTILKSGKQHILKLSKDVCAEELENAIEQSIEIEEFDNLTTEESANYLYKANQGKWLLDSHNFKTKKQNCRFLASDEINNYTEFGLQPV